MEREDAWVEEEGEFEGAHGFEHAHGVRAAVGGFGAGWGEVRLSWTDRGTQVLPLKARDLRRPSMYMLNSFKFSGRTSWPGG